MADEQQSIPVMVRITPQMARALDAWRRQTDDLPTRPEAIRRLIEQALAAGGARGKR